MEGISRRGESKRPIVKNTNIAIFSCWTISFKGLLFFNLLSTGFTIVIIVVVDVAMQKIAYKIRYSTKKRVLLWSGHG
jgi:hypothetical protein